MMNHDLNPLAIKGKSAKKLSKIKAGNPSKTLGTRKIFKNKAAKSANGRLIKDIIGTQIPKLDISVYPFIIKTIRKIEIVGPTPIIGIVSKSASQQNKGITTIEANNT